MDAVVRKKTLTKVAIPLLAVAPYAILLASPGAGTKLPAVKGPKQGSAKKIPYSEVEPIFRAHCTSCHTDGKAQGGLNLATPAGIKKGGLNGALFVPGNPAKSVLIERVKGHGGKPRMPLGFAPLSTAQTKTLEDWIATGGLVDAGSVKGHWSYSPPTRPDIPTVQRKNWVRNPIDAFILSRLEKGSLGPSPEASKETLLRRASLDLTGLPPTPEEMDAFLTDTGSDAYERAVERLLASPHYGERQAQFWLDLARYADSDGYEKDLRRSVWKYRDWLIAAFNRNLPYDQFTIEQIAGDLLPQPSLDQLLATGFHRNTLMNLEGGVDQEEAHFKVVLDRVDTTSTVWLGSTLACARCHDHKYDPFSQKDYYKMAAFFANSAIYPRGPKEVSEEKWYEAEIPAPSPEQERELKRLLAEFAQAERPLKEWTPVVKSAFENWKSTASTSLGSWNVLIPATASSVGGAMLAVSPDGTINVTGPNPERDSYELAVKLPAAKKITGLRIEALPDPSLTAGGPGRSNNGNFVLSEVKMSVDGIPVKFNATAADYNQSGFESQRVLSGDAKVGWAVMPEFGKRHEIALAIEKPISGNEIKVQLAHNSPFPQHSLGRFRVSVSSESAPLNSVLPNNVRIALGKADRNASEEELLRSQFANTTPLLANARIRRDAAKKELDAIRSRVPTALVMRDKPASGPLSVHLRERGEFLSKAELVYAGTPAILPKLDAKAKGNRLDLAKWLVRRDNPLTARVQINRMWEQVFGNGLVRTSEDFGTQGDKPTHPELLDWLAVEFMDKGWDLKAMHRMIVTSATYRQSSNATQALLQRDPENRLLARGPRFRLEAETIRDVSLAASGLLDRRLGGPSVFPWQPDGIWDSPFSGERWTPSSGKDAYRRGIYTFWKRTSPYPSFMALDAASREACTVKRGRTNTPLQALALLNDDGTFLAAKALGEIMSSEPSVAAGVEVGFRRCTGRRPKPEELERLKSLHSTIRARYQNDPENVKQLGGNPDKAAWTLVANVLLNLDETITKG